MKILIILWLLVLTVCVWFLSRKVDKQFSTLLRGHSALFWALKNKKVIDMNDMKEGGRVAKGEKMGDLSLKDFVDVHKS